MQRGSLGGLGGKRWGHSCRPWTLPLESSLGQAEPPAIDIVIANVQAHASWATSDTQEREDAQTDRRLPLSPPRGLVWLRCNAHYKVQSLGDAQWRSAEAECASRDDGEPRLHNEASGRVRRGKRDEVVRWEAAAVR